GDKKKTHGVSSVGSFSIVFRRSILRSFTAAERGADIQEVGPSTEIIAVADRRVVDPQDPGAGYERSGLVKDVPEAAADSPAVAVVVHGPVVEEVVIRKPAIPAQYVAAARPEAGIAQPAVGAEDVAEHVDAQRVLRHLAQIRG